MKIQRITSSLFGVAMAAASVSAFATESMQSFGRDCGARWMNGAPVTAMDTQPAGDLGTNAGMVYGREGRSANADTAVQSGQPLADMPQLPGRQGRLMSIDTVRG